MKRRDPRNYLIKKRMQLGLTFRFMFLVIVFTIFITFEVYIAIWPVVLGYIPQELISHVGSQILFRFLIFTIPVIIVIAMIVIIFTHRISGPIYRIEKMLARLLVEGDVELISLRKDDELQELAGIINKLILMVKKSNASSKTDPLNTG